MADFAEKAFTDAVAISDEKEFQAYRKAITKDFDKICVAAGEEAGLDNMNKLSGLLIRNGCAETLAEFVSGIAMICFHEGYQAGRLAE